MGRKLLAHRRGRGSKNPKKENERRKGKEKGKHRWQIPVASPISPPPHSDLRVSVSVLCGAAISMFNSQFPISNFQFQILRI
ncbi:hypothetical protein VNO78_23326 [Psophocarpus tetragonolobus]|uniref:Uncharacterized protein n=1 Tax=Psophocarpus tetragonolobus TaxID=3891 RepID=A0AAN9S6F9_PSOTE